MNFIKDNWAKKDIDDFQKYLYSLRNEEKEEWTKNIVNTNMKVLAIKSPILRDISKNILKGNYLSFLDYMLLDYYENSVINGYIISKIKDFDIMKKYLDIYSNNVDSWGTCDILSFNIKGSEDKYLNLSKEYINSNKPFVRRIGIIILFHFVKEKKYLKEIFKVLNKFENENEYYVNMINAWLICECFILHRNETINFLDNSNLNKFTINKAIQKCRDSFRVNKEDKDMLLKYKK